MSGSSEAPAGLRIVAAPHGDAWVRLEERDLSPPEIAASILERMKRIAEAAAGEPVTPAIINVPASFNDAQRQATQDLRNLLRQFVPV